jgi:hypothetical protein
MRVTFQKVSIKAKRVWMENGKRRQQTKEFWQTISPFNTDHNGVPKTREHIMAQLLAERSDWLKSTSSQNSGDAK